MKEYKGIYHDNQDTIRYYEFGAHFKYEELFHKLKELQKERSEEIPVKEDRYNSLQIEDNLISFHKRKKYKLKTISDKENARYFNVKSNLDEKGEDDNKDIKISIIEEEHYSKHKRKKNKLMTHSLDKVRLPKINTKNSNHVISLKNKLFSINNELTESNDDLRRDIIHNNSSKKKFSLSKNLRNKNFPKINSFHIILQHEAENNHNNRNTDIETQSLFKDNSVKIYNNNRNISNAPSDLIKLNFFTKDEKKDIIDKNYKFFRKNERLKSIFDKEKQITNNNNINLFLGENNNYSKENVNKNNYDEMSQHIYNLKKKLLGNSLGKSKKVLKNI